MRIPCRVLSAFSSRFARGRLCLFFFSHSPVVHISLAAAPVVVVMYLYYKPIAYFALLLILLLLLQNSWYTRRLARTGSACAHAKRKNVFPSSAVELFVRSSYLYSFVCCVAGGRIGFQFVRAHYNVPMSKITVIMTNGRLVTVCTAAVCTPATYLQ